MSDLTEYQKDGHNVHLYNQAIDRSKVEEFKGAHAAYDLLGLYRAYERGKYGVTEQTLKTFADTIQYVIDAGNGQYYYKVDADPTYGTFVTDWSQYLYMTPLIITITRSWSTIIIRSRCRRIPAILPASFGLKTIRMRPLSCPGTKARTGGTRAMPQSRSLSATGLRAMRLPNTIFRFASRRMARLYL
jgi:hypothetical protein